MELNGMDDKLLFGDDTEVAVPPTLVASAPVVDMSFHPHLPLLALGLVTGEVEVFEIVGGEAVKKPLQSDFANWVFGRQKIYSESEVVLNYHNQNMRVHPTGGVSALEFTDDGNYLVSASSDRTVSVVDCATSRLVIHLGSDDTKRTPGKRRARATTHGPPLRAPSCSRAVVAAEKLPRGADEEATRAEAGEHSANGAAAGGAAATMRRRRTESTPRGRGLGSVRRTAAVNPHRYGISALNICDANLVATGDDDGLIAVWDMRARRPAHRYHEHGDYITQLCYFTDAAELVSSSGDTCLGVFDTRAGRVRDYSEPRQDELSCFAFVNSSGVGSANFVPTILCGTPAGVLPMWKYGSWRRPYDVLESHPRECEAMLAFHTDGAAFNHNLVLTGAADGLVRVIQMYPVRRNLCQLSARDYSYAHAHRASPGGGGGDAQRSSFAVRRARRDEAILRMRVSQDGAVLAVSGTDAMVDFVDVRFLNDSAALDALRGKAERRHMGVIRDMERQANETAHRGGVVGEGEERGAVSSCALDDAERADGGTRHVHEEEPPPRTKRTRADTAGAANTPKTRNEPRRPNTACSSSSSADEPARGAVAATAAAAVRHDGKQKTARVEAMDSMEAYELSRTQKREQTASARWLKDEKKKKINFTFEKRRRRVGGFFGDIFDASREGNNERG